MMGTVAGDQESRSATISGESGSGISKMLSAHQIWSSPILRAVSANWLTAEDLRTVAMAFSVARSAHDECRAGIGGTAASGHGAVGTEGQSSEKIPTFARYFAGQYQEFCRTQGPTAVETFLGLGEQILSRLEAVLSEAFERAGQEPRGNPAPADGPAAEPGTASAVRDEPAAGRALFLYGQLLEDLYQAVRFGRMSEAFDRIQSRRSLEREDEPPIPLYPGVGEVMLVERDDARSIEFTVERYPCTAETLDPRIVRIPPGKTNNLHKHAHETLFCFIEGTGEILVGTTWVPVKPGDAVFAPRWAMHQTRNTGGSELVLLAITDYYLTSKVYVGKYDKI
jgi:mannose-6-phosphate isomerase-like protein (cupin superfamily)